MSERTKGLSYAQKLLDPRWQKRRIEILNRDEYSCVYCGDNKNQLQVHHETYYGDPWEINPDNLKTLCCHCHSMVSTFQFHLVKKVFKNQSGEFTFFCVRHQDKAVSFITYHKPSDNWQIIAFGTQPDTLNRAIEFIQNGGE